MSMKRTKQKSTGKEKDAARDFWAKPAEIERTWEESVEGKPDPDFTLYMMTERFTKGQLILHPKFGKGIVTDVEPLRVEILFQEGKKKLGHGQT
jgi:hypothetical protein